MNKTERELQAHQLSLIIGHLNLLAGMYIEEHGASDEARALYQKLTDTGTAINDVAKSLYQEEK